MKYTIFENLLTKKEAGEIIKWTKDKSAIKCGLMPFGSPIQTSDKTSNNKYPVQKEDFTPAMRRISKWLSDLTKYPMSCQTWSILHYTPGQVYPLHHDGNGHYYTCYIYLNDVDGGETTFPNSNVQLKGKLGRGMLWQNYTMSTTFYGLPYLKEDSSSHHYAKTPRSGEKWGLQIFITDPTYIDERTLAYRTFALILLLCIVFAVGRIGNR